MHSKLSLLPVCFALALGACTGGDGGTEPPVDSGVPPVDSSTPDTAPPVDTGTTPTCGPPVAPYGTMVGRKFAPFDMNGAGDSLVTLCDGTPFDFYENGYCDSTFTVVSIAAGWCDPCKVESSMLTDAITEPYRDRGVRVIQILVQDPEGAAPDAAFCDVWVRRYGLTNTELLDPIGATQIYFPDNALPSTLIVDSEGVIRFRENGATEGLISLKAALDDLLAGSP